MWRSVGELRRRGSYLSVSAEKAQVATYASTHSVRTAIKHFSKAFGRDLKDLHRGLSYCPFPLKALGHDIRP